jgi:ribosomal RNA-processing protein 17
MLRESEAAGAIADGSDTDTSEWGGFEDTPEPTIIDHEDEYIDEDKYTTVKVESVLVTRDGLERPRLDDSEQEEEYPKVEEPKAKEKKRPPKTPKKKFRYETKDERRLGLQKTKAKKMSNKAKRLG